MVGGADESCKTWKDCLNDGKMCDGLQDVGCICKKGQCKISGKRKYKKACNNLYSPAGCGTMGAFFFTKCSVCSEDDCEDEGTCKWAGGKCEFKKGVWTGPEAGVLRRNRRS